MNLCFIYPYFPTQIANNGDRTTSSREITLEFPALPSLPEIWRNSNRTTKRYEHIDALDNQLSDFHVQTRAILEYYAQRLEAKLASIEAKLRATYLEIQRWRDLYRNLWENVIAVPIYTQPHLLLTAPVCLNNIRLSEP
ncbi:hypothetical protein TIFTF001_011834 [Ficus carica]|uniref:Uncharacterized protein n=1 Tax=Ficus carica TaxID=3494 RepID=A0AA88D145_FICCA|nr:hypothetical protein TIFTF001_011834 [Ficus carica]